MLQYPNILHVSSSYTIFLKSFQKWIHKKVRSKGDIECEKNIEKKNILKLLTLINYIASGRCQTVLYYKSQPYAKQKDYESGGLALGGWGAGSGVFCSLN